MPVLPLVLGSILLSADPTISVPAGPGYLPTGSAVELVEVERLAWLRDPRIQPLVFRRSRSERGTTILAEADGPGILTQLWFRAAEVNSNRRLRIELEGRSEPVLNVRLGTLLAGEHPHFPRPLVSAGWGAVSVSVPIGFRSGCRVVLDNEDEVDYTIVLLKLPGAEGVEPFTEVPSETESETLKQACALWSDPVGKLATNQRAEYVVAVSGRSTVVYLLPVGPHTIQRVEVDPTPASADAWRSAWLRLTWDGDGPETSAGVDLPLGRAFGQPPGFPATPFRSLFVGQEQGRWYLQFPMPYRHEAVLRIDSERPLAGRVRVWSRSGVDRRAGYFRAGGLGLEIGDRDQVAGVWMEGTRRPPSRLIPPLIPFGPDLSSRRQPGLADVGPLVGLPILDHEGGTTRAAAYRCYLVDPPPLDAAFFDRLADHDPTGTTTGFDKLIFWYSEHPGPTREGRPRN